MERKNKKNKKCIDPSLLTAINNQEQLSRKFAVRMLSNQCMKRNKSRTEKENDF